MNHYDEIDHEEHAAVDAMIAEERAAEMAEHEVILTDGDATLAVEWCLTCDAAATAECLGQ